MTKGQIFYCFDSNKKISYKISLKLNTYLAHICQASKKRVTNSDFN